MPRSWLQRSWTGSRHLKPSCCSGLRDPAQAKVEAQERLVDLTLYIFHECFGCKVKHRFAQQLAGTLVRSQHVFLSTQPGLRWFYKKQKRYLKLQRPPLVSQTSTVKPSLQKTFAKLQLWVIGRHNNQAMHVYNTLYNTSSPRLTLPKDTATQH